MECNPQKFSKYDLVSLETERGSTVVLFIKVQCVGMSKFASLALASFRKYLGFDLISSYLIQFKRSTVTANAPVCKVQFRVIGFSK
mgnify:CR=1 FL=1